MKVGHRHHGIAGPTPDAISAKRSALRPDTTQCRSRNSLNPLERLNLVPTDKSGAACKAVHELLFESETGDQVEKWNRFTTHRASSFAKIISELLKNTRSGAIMASVNRKNTTPPS